MILVSVSMEVRLTDFSLVDLIVDFYVILGRAGIRVAKRKHSRGKIGLHQKVTQSDAISWFKAKYDAVVLNR